MTFVIGRSDTNGTDGPAGNLGTYRALDGSRGASLQLDFDRPHAILIVGKRGYGKSYTLGVIAEELARCPGVAPVLVDVMGIFSSVRGDLRDDPIPTTVIESPQIAPSALDPRSWCELVGLSPESGVGSLVWQATSRATTLDGITRQIQDAESPPGNTRAAINHVELARSWGVFSDDGLVAADLAGPELSILDVSRMDDAAMNAITLGIGSQLYRARVVESVDRLPWLLIDEAHTFFDGIAKQALRTIVTRGRAPGVSVVTATQRPSAIPPVAISQSDILISHRLTAHRDLEALERAQPTYLNSSLEERMPTAPGEVIIVDDETESVHAAQIRTRETPHGGSSPRASTVEIDDHSTSPG